MKWELLSSEYLFSDTWLKARRDRCIRPGGKEVYPYYVMEYPAWVTAVGLTEDDKIVLVKQYRHALGEVCIETPGGCVDATDVNNEEAVKREFLEETGYAFDECHYLGRTSSNPSTNNNLMHLYLLRGGKKIQDQQLDPNEDIDVITVSIHELKGMLDRNEIIQAMHVTCIFYALQKLEKLNEK